MVKPFKGDFALTQGFGLNPENYAKFGLKGHNGLDFGLPQGTEVLAPHNGKIIEAAQDPTGYGNYLKIENDKEGSVLAHLLDFSVNVGDSVSEGQVVAHSNNTGNSVGPHLHWGYYLFPRDRGNGYAGFIDQQLFIPNTSGNMYKGYDLTNQESMKIAVDILVRVMGGEFVDKAKYDRDMTDIRVKMQTTIDDIQKQFDEYKTLHPAITVQSNPVPPTITVITPPSAPLPAPVIAQESFFRKILLWLHLI